MQNNWIKVGLVVILSAKILSGCSSAETNTNTAESAYAIAAEYEKSERFEEAIRKYNEVKNKYPYSSLATKAELAVADVYYKQESYAEAQISYQSFKELHPKHPQGDYVQYKLALSYFNQLPSTIDRDLAIADDTILAFTTVVKDFPNSEYVKESKEKRSITIKMLAEKEQYIADFYFKQKNYLSALRRYEVLIANYSGLGFDEKALARASLSAARIKDEDKAKAYDSELRRKFPNSKELKKVDAEAAQ